MEFGAFGKICGCPFLEIDILRNRWVLGWFKVGRKKPVVSWAVALTLGCSLSLSDVKERHQGWGVARQCHCSVFSFEGLPGALCPVLYTCLVKAGLLGHFTFHRLMHPFLLSLFQRTAHLHHQSPCLPN